MFLVMVPNGLMLVLKNTFLKLQDVLMLSMLYLGLTKVWELRKQAWHEANKEVKAIESSTNKRKKGRPRTDDKTSIKLSEAIRNATQIKGSTYSLGKAPEKLTNNQKQRLEYIAATQPKLFRGYKLKEQLRLVFKLDNIEDVKVELKDFFFKATHSRIDIFKELAYKIRRHEEHIFNTIETQLSNARIESMNNKINYLLEKLMALETSKI